MFLIQKGIVVIMALNNGECRACTNDKTVLTTVATLHGNNWATCKFVSFCFSDSVTNT